MKICGTVMRPFAPGLHPRSMNNTCTAGGQLAPATTAPAADGFNLLRLRFVRARVQWRGFPYLFQALMLTLFVALTNVQCIIAMLP